MVHIRQPGFQGTQGATLAGMLLRETERWTGVASGSALFAPNGSSTGLALLSAALRTDPWHALRLEGGGTGTAFGGTDLHGAHGGSLFARASWSTQRVGTWGGAGAGTLARDGPMRPSFTVDGGLWMRRAWGDLTASLVHVRTRRDDPIFAPIPYRNTGSVSDAGIPRRTLALDYADATLDARVVRGRAELNVLGGVRVGEDGARHTQPFATASAAWRIFPNIAIALGAGRQLADLTRGTASASFATLALRLTPTPNASAARREPRRTPGAGGGSFVVEPVRGAAGMKVVRLRAPWASRVELMADFTDWRPLALEARASGWERRLAIETGTHRVLVRIDGGEWIAPIGLPVVDDDFGGKVGLLVVP